MKKLLITAMACLTFVSGVNAKAMKEMPVPVPSQHPIELRLVQQEMAVEIPNYGAAPAAVVGGLLGALVGAAINSASVANAEKRVASLRNELVDYNFNSQFEKAFREKFNASLLSSNTQVATFTTPLWNDVSEKKAVIGQKIIAIQPGYAMSTKFDELNVTINMTVADRIQKPNGKIKVDNYYTRVYQYTTVLTEDKQRASAGAQAATELGGKVVSNVIDHSIHELLDMMAVSLTPEIAGKTKKSARPKLKNYSLYERNFKAAEVGKTSAGQPLFFQRAIFDKFLVMEKFSIDKFSGPAANDRQNVAPAQAIESPTDVAPVEQTAPTTAIDEAADQKTSENVPAADNSEKQSVPTTESDGK
jgi:ribosomal protein S30